MLRCFTRVEIHYIENRDPAGVAAVGQKPKPIADHQSAALYAARGGGPAADQLEHGVRLAFFFEPLLCAFESAIAAG